MKVNIKHIVFLSPGFPESEKDSTTIPALQDFLIALKNSFLGVRMTVISFQYPFTCIKYNWNGYKVIPLNGKNKIKNKVKVWYKASKLLMHLHREYPISILHSFWLGECSFIANKFARKNGIKHVITAMGQDVLKPNKFINHFLKIDKASVITLSEKHSDILFENFNIESTIIPWGIPLKSISEKKNCTIDVLGVGALNEVKNYSDFIEIISEIKKKHSNIKVEIIGDGMKREEIKNIIFKKDLNKNIKLIGKISRNEVLSKMENAKVLLHTSTFESFGMVFIEALNAGMSIVSYQVGIAKNSAQWKIGNHKVELEMLLLEALNTPNKINYDIDFSIKKTVQLYNLLYNE